MSLFEIRAFARDLLVVAALCIMAVAAGMVLWLCLDTRSADAADAPPPQLTCLPISDMRAMLLKEYGEIELSGGMINDQAIFFIFAKPDGSTWTSVLLGTNGLSCAVYGGQNWVQPTMPTESF